MNKCQGPRARGWTRTLCVLLISVQGTVGFLAPILPSKIAPAAVRPLSTRSSPLFLSAANAADAVSTPVPSAERVTLRGLRSERFRHPLDEEATQRLRRLPGLEWVVRRFLRVVEEAVYLDNIGSAVLVGPQQMASIHNLVVEACKILDVETVPEVYVRQNPVPNMDVETVLEVYVRQNPVPNAYCLAFQGRKPFIMLHTSIIDLLTPAELQAVIAHELGHIKCEHGVWTTAANGVALGLYSLGGVLGQALAQQIQGLLLAWQRSAELSCDRAALLVAQDLNVVVSVMLKLVGGSRTASDELNPTEFLNQARSYEKARGSPLGRMLLGNAESMQTHPLPVVRAQELEKWYAGPDFHGILGRGTTKPSA